jgi:hypothetical protein
MESPEHPEPPNPVARKCLLFPVLKQRNGICIAGGIAWNLRKSVDLVLKSPFRSDMLLRFAKSVFPRALSVWVIFAGFFACRNNKVPVF